MTQLNVGFSREDFEAVATEAQKRGFTVTAFVRDQALRGARRDVSWSDNVTVRELCVTPG